MLKPDYRMQVGMNFVRLFPNAGIEGGRRPPTIADDVSALHYLLCGVYPVESLLAYLIGQPKLTGDRRRAREDVLTAEELRPKATID